MDWNNPNEVVAAELDALGLKAVWPPVRCKPCRALVKQVVKRYRFPVCYHCHMTKRKALASIVLASLLLLCGCASAPSKASVEIKVAGQSVVMNFRK